MVVYLELAFLFSSVVVANGLKAFLCNNNETSKIKVSTQIKPCEPVSLSETVNKPIQVLQILPKLKINAVSCRILRSSIGYTCGFDSLSYAMKILESELYEFIRIGQIAACYI